MARGISPEVTPQNSAVWRHGGTPLSKMRISSARTWASKTRRGVVSGTL